MTISEQLFAEYCRRNGLHCERVPEAQDRKTADYCLNCDGAKVYVEVKQVDPSPVDVEHSKALARGELVTSSRTPGQRLRDHLREAASQLRAYTRAGHPGLVIAYDNTGFGYLDSYEVLTAMFGLQSVVFAVPHDPSIEPWHVGDRFGAQQTTTPKQNTSISAVGVLAQGLEGLTLAIFHNKYARVRLDPARFHCGARHFALPGGETKNFQEWVEI